MYKMSNKRVYNLGFHVACLFYLLTPIGSNWFPNAFRHDGQTKEEYQYGVKT